MCVVKHQAETLRYINFTKDFRVSINEKCVVLLSNKMIKIVIVQPCLVLQTVCTDGWDVTNRWSSNDVVTRRWAVKIRLLKSCFLPFKLGFFLNKNLISTLIHEIIITMRFIINWICFTTVWFCTSTSNQHLEHRRASTGACTQVRARTFALLWNGCVCGAVTLIHHHQKRENRRIY